MGVNSKILESLNLSSKELLDLSARNRLVSTPRGRTRSTSIEITDAEADSVYKRLVVDHRFFSFAAGAKKEDDPEGDSEAEEINQQDEPMALPDVSRIAPETRYEELYWAEGKTDGTNAMLRRELNGQLIDWCDVVFDWSRVWLEVKHSWTWMTFRDPRGPNRSYKKHLLGESKNSALSDARDKLPCLIGKLGVHVIGLLVIALDSEFLRHSLGDIAALERAAGLDVEPWRKYVRSRCSSTVAGYETIGIQPFLWLRPAQRVAPAPIEQPV